MVFSYQKGSKRFFLSDTLSNCLADRKLAVLFRNGKKSFYFEKV